MNTIKNPVLRYWNATIARRAQALETVREEVGITGIVVYAAIIELIGQNKKCSLYYEPIEIRRSVEALGEELSPHKFSRILACLFREGLVAVGQDDRLFSPDFSEFLMSVGG